MTLTTKQCEFFTNILGERFFTDVERTKIYALDWTKNYTANASAVVLPQTTEEVSRILAFCNAEKIAVVPSGGRTGLAAAAVAHKGELVLSLERMNKILKIDLVGMYAEVEAGVLTQTLQEKALENGAFFALDLASKGSCQIGGNIATNAGGLKLIRYGGMREQVLGIEAVLADGRVLDMNTTLRKNNTGYDLKQLFIASEGTLGVITKASLRLVPQPKALNLACLALKKFEDILAVLELVHKERQTITAFEFFSQAALDRVCYAQKKSSPFDTSYPYYALLEIEQEQSSLEGFENLLSKFFEQELVADGVLATSQSEFHRLWSYRELISESVTVGNHVYKNDIALPVEELARFVAELDLVLAKAPSDIKMIIFGHIGDGNIHLNYLSGKLEDFSEFMKKTKKLEADVFSLLKKYRGSISAEHGIGLLKKNELSVSKSDLEVDYMRQIKAIFDPNGILNPGKVF
ncbi:MAG: FAD-binding oxidoreductase [Oligoflexales bacterium]|nr:FAD-binding oxidoreductase [Oligoflexales bacterium]